MKRFLLVVAVLILVAAMLGQDARQAVIGSGFIKDQNDIITNPAYALSYAGFASLELGNFGANNAWAMASVPIHNNLVVGAHFNRQDGPIFDMAAAYGMPTPINGLGLYGATGFGDMNFGFGIYTASKKEYSKVEPSTGSDSESTERSGVFQVNLGVEAELFAAAVGIGFNSFEDVDDPGNEFSSEGGMEISAKIYSEIQMSNSFSFVPIASFRTGKFNTKSVVGTTTTESGDMSAMMISAGVAANYTVLGTGIVSAGLSFDMYSEKDESVSNITDTYTMMSMPRFNFAAEVPFMEKKLGKSDVPMKCIARAGIKKSLIRTVQKRETSTATTTSKTNLSEPNSDLIAVGFGVNVSNFYLDMMISENIFYTGSYAISGVPQALSATVSLGYRF